MNKIKKAYYYLFYRLYKYYNSGTFVWGSDWKAVFIIEVLWLFIGGALLVYYKVFIDRSIHIGDSKILLIVFLIAISVPHYFIFHHRDQWKEIVNEYDKLPKKKNLIYTIVVLLFILLVFFNFFFAFYLMSQIDWSVYR
jgi:hypothetical protein